MARPFIILLVIFFNCQTVDAKTVKLRDFYIPEWESAGAYGDSTTKKLEYCTAGGSYKSNIYLHVVVYRDYGWALGFSRSDWHIPSGPIPLAYRFDNGPWLSGIGTYMDPDFFVLNMPSESTLVSLFRRSRRMEVKFSEGRYAFRLDGTSRLIAALAGCVKTSIGAEDTVVAKNEQASPPTNSTTAASKPRTTPRDSSGSGFLVSRKGYILTNNHLVKECSSITVSRTGDIARPAVVIRSDAINDLAVLKTDIDLLSDEIARFRSRSVRAGESVAIFGFPLAGTLSASGNIVSGNVSSLAGLADDVRLLQISAPIQPGNSGGPLMDYTGAVVGIVNGKLNDLAAIETIGSLPQNVNFSIKANVGMNFLDAHSIPYELSTDTTPLDLPTIAEKAKKFTIFISCRQKP